MKVPKRTWGMVTHSHNPSTQEPETGGSLGYGTLTLSKNNIVKELAQGGSRSFPSTSPCTLSCS